TPKPLEYIKDIIDQMSQPDDLILDFFAGTGTTAHAAYELNKADGGNRRVILMESKDLISENHVAFKAGYKRICEITEQRLKYLSSKDTNYTYAVENISDPFQNAAEVKL
ncbi:hypothetical protein CGH67_01440, partial [Vibrio parahaemolyticus]